MIYNFDEIIDRRGTDSVNAEDYRAGLFGRAGRELQFPCPEDEVIRMWVADMDFATPDVIIEGIQKRLERRIFGYTEILDPTYFDTFAAWTQSRYGWQCKREELLTCNGVVPALYELVEYICAPDEKVLIMTPSYGPFQKAADYHGRPCLQAPLKKTGSHYEIDFEALEALCADPKLKLCIFCNPHNPTGRLWTEDELRRFGQLMVDKQLWVVSDEIHCDLLRSGKQHIPLAKLFPDYSRIVTCMAPSKTFNIAGLMHSHVIIPDAGLRKIWRKRHHGGDNPLSVAAARAAYESGGEWLTQLQTYLDGNFAVVKEALTEKLPEAVFDIPEASYLAWIDLGAYFPPEVDMLRFFAEQAGVLLEDETMFVGNAKGCVRLNLACPRAFVVEAMRRICEAVSSYGREGDANGAH